MELLRKISYNELKELVISIRSLGLGFRPSISFQYYYVGVRVYAPKSLLSSAVLSLFNQYYEGICWFIELDAFNTDYYFVNFHKRYLQ